MSLSIAAKVAPRLTGDSTLALARRVRGAPDAWLVESASASRSRCEVKGSGAGWVSVTPTDRQADRVMWVDYSRRLADQTKSVVVYLFDGALFRDAASRSILLPDIAAHAIRSAFFRISDGCVRLRPR